MSCATPPYANASGTTTAVKVAVSPVSRPALMQLRTTVVNPNPARPRGAGFAGRESSFDIECLLSCGWIEIPATSRSQMEGERCPRILLLPSRGRQGLPPRHFSREIASRDRCPGDIALLRTAPAAHYLAIPRRPRRLACRYVRHLPRIALQIEQPCPARSDLIYELPAPVAQAQQSQRVVCKEECHSRRGIEHRAPLVILRRRNAHHVQDGG